DVVVLPGGTLNGDNLRTDETVQGLLRSFSAAGKPVAAICHAPWTLIEAGLVDGQKLTSVPTIRTDLVNAGGNWSDEEVTVDDAKGLPLITSRGPDDLDAFNGALIEALSSGPRSQRRAAPSPGGSHRPARRLRGRPHPGARPHPAPRSCRGSGAGPRTGPPARGRGR